MPVVAQGSDGVPQLDAAPGVEAGGGLVEEEQPGRAHQAGPEVEAPAHPARVRLDQTVTGLGQAETIQRGVAGGLRRAPRTGRRAGPPWPGSLGRSSSLRRRRTGRPGRSCGARSRASRTTSWPATMREPASGRSKVATVRTNVVLPAPLGPKMATMRPEGRVRSRSVQGGHVPEALGEAAGLEQCGHRCSSRWRTRISADRERGWLERGRSLSGCPTLWVQPRARFLRNRPRGFKASGPRAPTRGPEPFLALFLWLYSSGAIPVDSCGFLWLYSSGCESGWSGVRAGVRRSATARCRRATRRRSP